MNRRTEAKLSLWLQHMAVGIVLLVPMKPAVDTLIAYEARLHRRITDTSVQRLNFRTR